MARPSWRRLVFWSIYRVSFVVVFVLCLFLVGFYFFPFPIFYLTVYFSAFYNWCFLINFFGSSIIKYGCWLMIMNNENEPHSVHWYGSVSTLISLSFSLVIRWMILDILCQPTNQTHTNIEFASHRFNNKIIMIIDRINFHYAHTMNECFFLFEKLKISMQYWNLVSWILCKHKVIDAFLYC